MLGYVLVGSEDILCLFHTIIKYGVYRLHSSLLTLKSPSVSEKEKRKKKTHIHGLNEIYNGTEFSSYYNVC